MNDHVETEQLNALADGELRGDDLVGVQEHLAECATCTSAALAASLTKRAAIRVGLRHAVPGEFKERMQKLAAGEGLAPKPKSGFKVYAWGSIAAMLLLGIALFVAQRGMRERATTEALLAEVSDRHIATMAGNAPPQVISSDRHTVKPWFQGKLPFSFNLPENLPADTTLDGADLTYLHGQPAAQLFYSVGKHHVSIFVRQSTSNLSESSVDRSGFHVASIPTGELEVVGVSDVEAPRLFGLVNMLAKAQTAN